MPTSKKRKFERKTAKQYKMLSFTDPVFGEKFVLPTPDQAPIKVITGMNQLELGPMRKWLEDAGAETDAVDALLEMDQDEVQEFMEVWRDGEISAPKSSA